LLTSCVYLYEVKIFPLNIAILPGERVPLHIFEPRYKAMIEDNINNGENFGICLSFGGKVSQFGTEVKVHKIQKTFFDGSSDIIVKGVRSFKILEYRRDPSKKVCDEAETIPIDLQGEKASRRDLLELYNEYSDKFVQLEDFDVSLLDLSLVELARGMGLSYQQKDRYIGEKSSEARENILFAQVKYLLFIKQQEENREFNILLN